MFLQKPNDPLVSMYLMASYWQAFSCAQVKKLLCVQVKPTVVILVLFHFLLDESNFRFLAAKFAFVRMDFVCSV